MQTILGAGGAIGTPLAKELSKYTHTIRLVGRSPKAVNPTDELVKANLLNAAEVDKAVEGSEVVYLMVGLLYDAKVWQRDWPIVMQNTINACKKHNTKLVFFDNVYALGYVDGVMTEETPFNPISKKGKVRAQIAQMLLDEMKSGSIQALIARAPDFYGPNVSSSMLDSTFIQNIAKGEKPMLIGKEGMLHCYIYTHDAAIATAMLGNTPDAYNQTWNLPTVAEPITPQQLAGLFSTALGKEVKYTMLGTFMLKIVGLFTPIVKEVVEMMYQYNHHYKFDSAKFNKRFNFTPTPYKTGVEAIVKAQLS